MIQSFNICKTRVTLVDGIIAHPMVDSRGNGSGTRIESWKKNEETALQRQQVAVDTPITGTTNSGKKTDKSITEVDFFVKCEGLIGRQSYPLDFVLSQGWNLK